MDKGIAFETIDTGGIGFLTKLEESDLYYGLSTPCGDLYEAEELYRDGREIDSNRLIFVCFEENRVYEPLKAEKGTYFERPLCIEDEVFLLRADFVRRKIAIYAWNRKQDAVEELALLDLDIVKDCYNLRLAKSPLSLVRSGHENLFQVLWPERSEFMISPRESLDHREGDYLLFSMWHEDPDYREEVIVRKLTDGTVLERHDGCIYQIAGKEYIVK